MKLTDALDRELDRATGGGLVHAEGDGGHAEIDVVETDRLGVRVRRVRVEAPTPHDLDAIAERWPRRIRELPDRVCPIEVDPRLGGATLRSDPDDRADETFVEVEVRGATTEIRRHRPTPEGRDEVEWTMTREQLRRLVETLGGDEPGG